MPLDLRTKLQKEDEARFRELKQRTEAAEGIAMNNNQFASRVIKQALRGMDENNT
jgi:hypothetical protein